jgi:hypothetical protein
MVFNIDALHNSSIYVKSDIIHKVKDDLTNMKSNIIAKVMSQSNY